MCGSSVRYSPFSLCGSALMASTSRVEKSRSEQAAHGKKADDSDALDFCVPSMVWEHKNPVREVSRQIVPVIRLLDYTTNT